MKLQRGVVTLCFLSTFVGYGSILFADNQALRSFGCLAISGEVACLMVAALFLPSFLHLIGAHVVKRSA